MQISGALVRGTLLSVLAAVCPAATVMAGPATAPAGDEGPAYRITRFDLAYSPPRQGVPQVSDILAMEVELGVLSSGYVNVRPGIPRVRFPLAEAANQPLDRYHPAALQAICAQIVRYFNQKGLISVFVAVHADDIDVDSGRDLRPADRTSMRLVILVGVAEEVRTVASGERLPPGQRLNNPLHKWILDESPVKPASVDPTPGANLLRKNLLDDYVARLNRAPFRRVDIAVASAEEPGGVVLDYLVAEAKPWTVYGQVSNTGTEETDEWRQRVGFIHNDLTKRGDVLSLDFVTAAFDESNAVLASYEAPLWWTRKLRWRVFGTWTEFTASDVGQAGQDFTGDEYTLGGELIANVFQRRELFIDAVGGLRFKHVTVTDETGGRKGEGDFWQPYVGLRLERTTERASTHGLAMAQFGIGSDVTTKDAGVSRDSADGLGRLEADEDWVAFQFGLTHSFFLEPLLSRNYKTLAHEVALSGRIQWAPGYRLIPQEQEILGGLYSVRGYPESLVAGDTTFVGSVEYRFHLPRALKVQPDPASTPLFGRPFRFAPQQPYGRPDWDLVFKGFLDAGRSIQNDKLDFEENQSLVGTGVGMEFAYKQNLTVRVEWGVALSEIEDEVDTGDSRVHFVFTLLY